MVYKFDTLSGLAQLFKHTHYSNPMNFFFDKTKQIAKKVVDSNNEQSSIDCLMLFKDGIEP